MASVVAVVTLAGCGGDAPATTEAVETEPPLEQLGIIFPEGFTIDAMTERVAAVRQIAIDRRGVTPRLTGDGYRRAVANARPPKPFRRDWSGKSLEGFLFPARYEFTQETTASELVADQLRAFRLRFARLGLAYAKSKNLTPYDVLKIASMVEAEAAVASERKLIAAVIYNRLRAGMPLGIDATIRYGLGIPNNRSLTKKAINSDSPWNSRRVPGLPPTPISNPGLASLKAAAHPAKTDALYFVRIPGTQRHFFTASETEFLRKVCEFGYACD